MPDRTPITLTMPMGDDPPLVAALSPQMEWSGDELFLRAIRAIDDMIPRGPHAGDPQWAQASFVARYFGATLSPAKPPPHKPETVQTVH